MPTLHGVPVSILVLAISAHSPSLQAQEGSEGTERKDHPAANSKVRITTRMASFPEDALDSKGRIVGMLIDYDENSMTVETRDGAPSKRVVVPRDAILRLEVKEDFTGKTVLGLTAVTAISTALGAGLAVLLTGAKCETGELPASECRTTGENAAEGAKWGAAWGVGLSVVGLALGGGWKDSPLPGTRVAIGLQRSGVGVSVSFSF